MPDYHDGTGWWDTPLSRPRGAPRADDRKDLKRMDSDEARTFARENPDAGAEDYERFRRRRSQSSGRNPRPRD
jgi:hypothetical protein